MGGVSLVLPGARSRRILLWLTLLCYGLLALSAATPGERFAISPGLVVTNDVPGAGAGRLSVKQEVDVYTFSVAAGDRLYFQDRGAATGIDWALFNSQNQQIFRDRFDGYSAGGRVAFATAGAFELRVFAADGNSIGSYSFTIIAVPDDLFTLPLATVITNGVPASGAGRLESPGKVDIFRFSGAPGQQLYFQDLGADRLIDWGLYDSNNQQIFRDRMDGYFPGWVTLASTNTYEVRVYGAEDARATGAYSFIVFDDPNDVFTLPWDTIVTNGVPNAAAGRLASPGQIDVYKLKGTAGQVLYFQDLGAAQDIDWGLYDSNNQQIFRDRMDGYFPGWITLASTNTYELRVFGAGDGHATGDYSFVVRRDPFVFFTLPLDTMVTNGIPNAAAGILDIPGQADIYRLKGAVGQELYFQDLGADQNIDWGLYDSNNQQIFRDRMDGYFPGWFTLASTNTYELRIFGAGDGNSTGRYSFSVRNAPADRFNYKFDTLITNGVPIAGAGRLDLPGQIDIYKFSGSVGQTLYFQDLGADHDIDWGLYDSKNQQVFRDRLDGYFPGYITLSTTNAYELRIFGSGDGHWTGNYSFVARNSPWDVFSVTLGQIVTNGVPGPGAGVLLTSGDVDLFKLKTTPGQTLYFNDLNADPNIDWGLYTTNNQQLFRDRLDGLSPGRIDFPKGGDFEIRVFGASDGQATGKYRFVVQNALGDEFPISAGTVVTNNVPGLGAGILDAPGVQDIFTFEAPAGRILYFKDYGATFSATLALVDSSDARVWLDVLDGQSIGNFQLTRGGRYKLIVQSGGDGKATGSYSFALLAPAPTILRQPESAAVVAGHPVSFSVAGESDTPIGYQWRRNGIPLAGATNTTFNLGSVNSELLGEYTVALSNATAVTISSVARLDLRALILAAAAARNSLPPTPGNGVQIELFNGIGGGAAPGPVDLQNRVPDGTTLSPVIDFPSPGQIINVGNSFDTFFAATTTPPDAVRNLSARNFVLRHQFYLRVSRDLDQDPATPEIDFRMGVGSDDGFYLTVGTNFLGSNGDRGFAYSWIPVAFESEGLYPVTLLYAANAAGQSGLELAWNTAPGNTDEIIPQRAMYVAPNIGDQLITFEELPSGTFVTNQFAARGVIFETIGGAPQVTTNSPARFVPVSPTHVFTDPAAAPTGEVQVDLHFVAGTEGTPGVTDFVSFFLLNAQGEGAAVTAYNAAGGVLYSNRFHAGGASQELVSLAQGRIARVRINLGAGAGHAGIDNLSFTTPRTGADLAMGGIQASASALPGGVITVVWAITNAGITEVRGPWTEQVFLAGTGAPNETLAAVTASENLRPGGFIIRTQEVRVPINGPAGSLRVGVRADAFNEVAEIDEGNNTALAVEVTEVPLWLTLTAPNTDLRETDAAIRASVMRNGDVSAPLTVTLSNSRPTEVRIPTNVVFAAGQRSALFSVEPLADGVVDGPQAVEILAEAPGFGGGRLSLVVEDADTPQLGLQFAISAAVEGATAQGTVSRPWPGPEPVTVFLRSSQPVRTQLPAAVIIPPNATNVSFPVAFLADGRPTSSRAISFVAEAAGYLNSDARTITLSDADLRVALELSRRTITEGDGDRAAVGTVSRLSADPFPLAFETRVSATNVVQVPARVIIPAGELEVHFPIGVGNDAVQNPAQVVSLSLRALDLETGEFFAETNPVELTVNDNDGPSLALTLDRRLVGKRLTPATTATVTRRGNTAAPLNVTLSLDDITSASAPASVTLNAGQESAAFTINTLGGGAVGTTKQVGVTASAPGFNRASETLIISDILQPDLVVRNVEGPALADTESFIGVSYRVENQGLAAFSTNVLTRLFLATNPGTGHDLFAGNFNFTGSIPPGEHFDQTLQIRLPTAPGKYWVIATTDLEDAVREILEDNNSAISATPIEVRAAYTAVAETSATVVPTGTQIVFQGRALKAGSNVPAPQVPVHLHLWVRETHRELLAVTGEDGSFSLTFTPLPNEAGSYSFAAAHPGVTDPPAQGRFTIVGLRGRVPEGDIKLIEGTPLTLQIPLENLSEKPLSGLQATVASQAPNVSAAFTFPNGTSLPGAETGTLSVVLTASDPNVIRSNLVIRVTSAEGAVANITLPVVVESQRARIVTNPVELLAGMKRGVTTTFDFELANAGGRETGPITLLVPELGWLRLVTASPLASIGAGQSNRVTLQFTPPADLPLGDYKGSLVARTEGSSWAVPFNFRVLSEAKGDLRISAVDEYTYYAEGAPPVTNAVVTVREANSGVVLTNGVTDATGNFVLPQIFEGYYEVLVSADQHISYHETSLVRAGVTNDVQAFLSREAVRYLWTVVPTEIEDRTKISIETEFETFVPIPVITIEPAVIDLAEITADVTQINLRISNHGLLAANDFRLAFTGHPDWQLEPLVSEFGALPARSSLTVPLTIRRLKGVRALGTVHALAGPCSIKGGGVWDIICGTKKSYSAPITVLNAGGDCPAGGGGGWGGSGAVGAPFVSAPYFPVKLDCSTNKNCQEFSLPEVNVSGILKPITKVVAEAANAYLSVQPWNFFLGLKFEVDPEVKGKIGVCCKDDQPKQTLTGEASGTVKITNNKGNIEKSLPTKFDNFDVAGETGSLDLDLKLFIGTKAVPSIKLSGKYELGCERDKPYWEVTVAGSVDLKSGLEGTAKGKFSVAGKPVKEATGGEVKGGVAGGITFSYTMDSEGKKKICYKSTGIYAFGSAQLFGKSVELFPGGKYYFIQPQEDCSGLSEPAMLAEVVRLAEVEAHRILAAEQPLARQSAPADEGGGVCARIRLKLDQDLVLTRNAFNASLELINNDPLNPLEEISVQVNVLDATEGSAGGLFDISTNQVTGMTAVDGSGRLAISSKGLASFLIIPGPNAAPEQATPYKVGGVLSYVQAGRRIIVPLAPVPITVLPDPRLFVKYFHQRDVYSDDPFTSIVEPSVPYSLAVMIQNAGKGEARNVHITSAQPQIIDNEKGLLIDFKILGTEVSGQPATPSLTVDFGTIPPGAITIGRWLMTSTLQGLFDTYEATVEHTAGPRDNRSSLLEDLSIHEMIHLVRAPAPFEDGRPDFLVNDKPDPEALPDTLYLSNGTTNEVAVIRQASVSGGLSSNSLSVQISAATGSDWSYWRVADPGQGNFKLRRVVRSDNREIPFGTNVWATDRTFIGKGRKPIRENLLHLFDYKSTGTYTLFYDLIPPPESIAPTSRVAPLPTESYAQIPVSWSGEDNPGGSGIAFHDIYVSVEGAPFVPWLEHSDQTNAVYFGQLGKKYAFFSVATDNAGNREELHTAADAQTTSARENHPPVLQAIADRRGDEGDVFLITPTASDVDADTLTWSLVGATPPGLQIHPATGEILWVTGAGLGPSTNRITVQVLDSGIPRLGALRSFNIVLEERNFPPEIELISSLTIREGQPLRLAPVVSDPDWPRQSLQYKLAAAPDGAAIDSGSGVITWRPNDVQGGSNYLIRFVVTDSGTPSLSATQALSVSVLDTRNDFTLRLGSTNLTAGAGSYLPVFLQTAVEITNVTFELTYPNTRVTNITLQPVAAGIASATLEAVSSNRFVARVGSVAGAVLPSNGELARVLFQADTNQSAVLSFDASNARATRANGVTLPNGGAEGAPVFLVRDQPVLGLSLVAGLPKLVLYSTPGLSFQLEYKNSLDANQPWTVFGTVEASSQATPISAPATLLSPTFLRVRQVDPNAARLSLARNAGTWDLILTAKPGNYILQSQMVKGERLWQNEQNLTLTNNALTIPGFTKGDAGKIFRAVAP